MLCYLCIKKGERERESKKEKKNSEVKTTNLSSSDYYQHEEANIWYSSQAGLDTASLDGANKKKVQKTALLVPVERGLENMAISIC